MPTMASVPLMTLVGPGTEPASIIYPAKLLSDKQFRVVRISPGKWNDPIKSNLVHRDMNEPSKGGQYRALSYVWGSPKVTSTIFVDDSTFQVTLNLFCALLHLRSTSEDIILWVDALCINQRDADERSRQVQLMQQIYSNAESVIVFIGDGRRHRLDRSDLMTPPSSTPEMLHGNSRDEPLLIKFIQACRTTNLWKLKSTFPPTLCAIMLVRLLRIDATDEVEGQSYRPMAFLDLEEDIQTYLTECLRVFVTSPWWTRIWVVQEIAVCKTAVIRYGTVTASWDVFVNAAMFCYSGHRTALVELQTEHRKVLDLLINHIAKIESTRGVWHDEGGMALVRLLQDFSNRQASDDRDKVFGLLSLAKQSYDIVPDYHYDTAQAYRNTALSLIRDSGLACWVGHQARKNVKDLPSWIPDWSTSFDEPDRERMSSYMWHNVNRRWELDLVSDECEYWNLVLSQIQKFLAGAFREGVATRELPTTLRDPVLKYIKFLHQFIDAEAARGSAMSLGVVSQNFSTDSGRIKPILELLIQECGRLASLCSGNEAMLGLYLFRKSYAFYGSASLMAQLQLRHLQNKLDHLWTTSCLTERFIEPRADPLICMQAIAIQTVYAGGADKVGPRMLSWSDGDAAIHTLREWFEMAVATNTRGGSLRELHFLDLKHFAEAIVGGLLFFRSISPRTATAPPTNLPALAEPVADILGLIEWLHYHFWRGSPVISTYNGTSISLPSRGDAKFDDLNSPSPPMPWYPVIKLVTEGRVFFLTDEGDMGLGPASTQLGDTVHIFPSGRTHFMLRAVERGSKLKPAKNLSELDGARRKLLGDCYLNGKSMMRPIPGDVAHFDENEEEEVQGSLPFEILGADYLGSRVDHIETVLLV